MRGRSVSRPSLRSVAGLGVVALVTGCLTDQPDFGIATVHVVSSKAVNFSAVGDTASVQVVALDVEGDTIPPADLRQVVTYASGNPVIVTVSDDGVMRSEGDGVSEVVVTASGISASVLVRVAQDADSLAASLTDSTPILSLAEGDAFPLVCSGVDRNGAALTTPPQVSSRHGTVSAGPCTAVVGLKSGFDTLTVVAGSLSVEVPIVLALRPQASSATGELVTIDSTPADVGFWAPSMRRNSSGELELYYSGYGPTDSTGFTRSNIYRLLSADGSQFRFDGVAISHDDDVCALDGRGVENVAVIPRNDGPGWRMFYSGGSDPCYGWQVFSAVSTNERTWTKEPGVRISNGGTVPPAPPIYAPWPAGEGMVVDRLPGGQWRMVLGGYEHLTPFEDKFQIVEWRSSDQLTWTYVGTVLTTRDMPAEANASIFSPTVREFAPGMYRMIFSGDNRTTPGGRSRLWSAVSIDRVQWQVEGELMGAPGISLWYATLVDDVLAFIRQDGGGATRLATATVTMP